MQDSPWLLLLMFRKLDIQTFYELLFLQDKPGWQRLVFRKLDIQTFNYKQICSVDQYCRHAILMHANVDFVFYDPWNLKTILVSCNLVFLMFSILQMRLRIEFWISLFSLSKTRNALWIHGTNGTLGTIRVPKVPFHFFDKLKHEIRKKVWLSFYWSWDIKNQTKCFSIFKITENWNSNLKFVFHFLFWFEKRKAKSCISLPSIFFRHSKIFK